MWKETDYFENSNTKFKLKRMESNQVRIVMLTKLVANKHTGAVIMVRALRWS